MNTEFNNFALTDFKRRQWANINFNKETGRVYVLCNENVQALLDNREKYLKPLQDRGIKIILGLLGNHDGSGVSNLSDAAARDFAQECKALADAYNLDGFFFDDEWSEYSKYNLHLSYPGFVEPSVEAASRLVYEFKKAMPERIMATYIYSTTTSLYEVDGVPSGEYVDYGLHDYIKGWDLNENGNYPGMPRSNQALWSQNFSTSSDGNKFITKDNLIWLRENGYGSHMLYAMNPFEWNFNWQLETMNECAEAFYDDTLVFDNKTYQKDWK